MNLIAIAAAWAAALNICIGVLVAVTGIRRPGHAPFAGLCGALALWNFGFALSYPQSADGAMFRLMYAGVVFIGPLTLHFILDFTGDDGFRTRRLLRYSYWLAGALLVLVLTGLYYNTPTAYIYFQRFLALFLLGLLLLGLRLLWQAIKETKSVAHRNRLTYCMGAGIVATAAGITDFFPAFGLWRIGVGNLVNLIYVIMIAVAILKHRLLNITATLRRAAVWLTVLAMASVLLSALLLVFGATEQTLVYGLPVIVLVAFVLLHPAWPRVLDRMERLTFPRRAAYRQALASFGQALPALESREEAGRVFLETVLSAMGVRFGFLELFERGDERQICLEWDRGVIREGGAEKLDDHLAAWAVEAKEPLLLEDLERAAGGWRSRPLPFLPRGYAIDLEEWYVLLLAALQRAEAQVVLPLRHGEMPFGLLALGVRGLAETYDQGDLALLSSLTDQLGVCLVYQERQRKLHATERLAALGEMVSCVTHEIRNPLTAIRGAADLLIDQQVDDEGNRLAEIVSSEADRLERILSRYLDYARPIQPEKQAENLEEITKRVLEMVFAKQSRNPLRLVVPEELPLVPVDAELYHQVLENLLNNAIQASEPGLEVTVRLTMDVEGVRVEVTDSGCGMDSVVLDRVFQPFFTTKGRGSGLGLPISRRIAEAHGGSLTLKSDPGHGTTAMLILPLPKTG